MAWNTSNSYSAGTVVNPAMLNGIGNDLRTFGGNVDAGGYNLTNVGSIVSAGLGVGASPIMLADIAGALAKTSTSNSDLLFLRSNEVSGSHPFGLRFRSVGGASIGVRSMQLQTTDYALADGGIISLQAAGGMVGIGTNSPVVSGSGQLHVAGDTARLFPTSRTPANSAATGNDGEICADASFVYLHTGGSWRRAALSTF